MNSLARNEERAGDKPNGLGRERYRLGWERERNWRTYLRYNVLGMERERW